MSLCTVAYPPIEPSRYLITRELPMKGLLFLPFVALTILSWGLYGPTLHAGQAAFGADGKLSAFRPFICVGLAYFLIAVIFPVVVLYTKGEKGYWSVGGFIWSFAAGGIGALGALGIILALKWGGSPIYVMPLVFGCAPVVNTFVTMGMAKNFKEASWPFYMGILVVAIGAAGVLVNKPAKPKGHDDHASLVVTVSAQPVSLLANQDEKTEQTPAQIEELEADQAAVDQAAVDQVAVDQVAIQSTETTVVAATEKNASESQTAPNWLADMVLRSLCILATALCWGAYGPVLHKGQLIMGGSRLRPFICVGLAYFAVAVIIPLLISPAFGPEAGVFTSISGWFWSLGAGAIGALGALGIIYAFNFGGKPLFVMPLVFGCAPVINTFSEIMTKGLWEQTGNMFFASLFLVIAGAVIVLTTAPKSAPPATKVTPPAT